MRKRDFKIQPAAHHPLTPSFYFVFFFFWTLFSLQLVIWLWVEVVDVTPYCLLLVYWLFFGCQLLNLVTRVDGNRMVATFLIVNTFFFHLRHWPKEGHLPSTLSGNKESEESTQKRILPVLDVLLYYYYDLVILPSPSAQVSVYLFLIHREVMKQIDSLRLSLSAVVFQLEIEKFWVFSEKRHEKTHSGLPSLSLSLWDCWTPIRAGRWLMRIMTLL